MGIYYASFSYRMLGHLTSLVNSLKQDDDPVIAINAISTGALTARASLRSVVLVKRATRAPVAPGHAQILFEFVN